MIDFMRLICALSFMLIACNEPASKKNYNYLSHSQTYSQTAQSIPERTSEDRESEVFDCLSYPDNNYDVDQLVIGEPNNLDVYQGAKFFQFGQRISEFGDCISCKGDDRYRWCRFTRAITFLNSECEVDLLFIDSALSVIKCNALDIYNGPSTYQQLIEIFGQPNDVKLKLVSVSDLITEYFTVNSDSKSDYRNYYESIETIRDEIFNYRGMTNLELMSRLRSETGMNSEPNYKDPRLNESMRNARIKEQERIRADRRNPEHEQRMVQYYPETKWFAQWRGNKVILDIDMTRTNQIDNQVNSYTRYTNGSKMTIRPQIGWNRVVTMYKDSRSLQQYKDYFNGLKLTRLEEEEEYERRRQAEQDQKILSEF